MEYVLSRSDIHEVIAEVETSGRLGRPFLCATNGGSEPDRHRAAFRRGDQLAGAIYGASAIPQRWLDALSWRPQIESTARALWPG
jgi:hypothetical protein